MSKQKNNCTLWNLVWGGDRYSNPQLRLEKARFKINNFKSMGINFDFENILDLGCGGGYVSYNIVSEHGCQILAVDISDNALKIAKEQNQHPKIQYVLDDAKIIDLPDNYFDAVFMVGVLEHIDNASIMLDKVFQSLKNKGKLFICTSHTKSVFLLQHQIYQKLGIWNYGYVKHYSEKELMEFVKKHEFSNIKTKILGCNGGRFILSSVDRLLSKMSILGRYILLVGEKNGNPY